MQYVAYTKEGVKEEVTVVSSGKVCAGRRSGWIQRSTKTVGHQIKIRLCVALQGIDKRWEKGAEVWGWRSDGKL